MPRSRPDHVRSRPRSRSSRRPEQKTQLTELQKAVDAGLDKMLTGDQKDTLKQLRADFARGGPGGVVRAEVARAAEVPVAAALEGLRAAALEDLREVALVVAGLRLHVRPAGRRLALPGVSLRAGLCRARRQGIEARQDR